MDHYTKTSSVATGSEEKKEPSDVHVKSGSKIRNIIAQAHRMLRNKKGERIVLTGSGPTVTKTITCAEIIKRKTRGLHQLNKLFYTTVEDTWEPKEESLDRLRVTKRIPCISIILSKVPLDSTQPGYQAPGKSKSPVQFGDEDWELAWEDDPPKAPQSAKNGQMDTGRKSEKKGNENGDINGESMITQDSSGNNEGPLGPLDRGENQGLSQDSTCESHKRHFEGAALRSENKGSQRTDTQRSKTTQRRPRNYKDHKPKASPHKKQKSEDV